MYGNVVFGDSNGQKVGDSNGQKVGDTKHKIKNAVRGGVGGVEVGARRDGIVAGAKRVQ